MIIDVNTFFIQVLIGVNISWLQRYKKEIIQTNNLPKNKKKQRNNSPIIEKIYDGPDNKIAHMTEYTVLDKCDFFMMTFTFLVNYLVVSIEKCNFAA